MSRLDALIQEFCPNGVDYLTIKECTQKVQNIKWKTYVGKSKKYIDLSSVDRDTHCIIETQYINPDSAPSRALQIVQKDDILFGTTRPMLKRYCMISEDYNDDICSTGFCVLRAKTNIVLPRWIYHVISTTDFYIYVEQNQKGASYPAISDANVKAFRLPVPPLEVQREIVHVLDSFTLLTAELTAELTARKKQYEYYRNALLVRDKTITLKSIDELCNVSAGGDAPKEAISKEKTDKYAIPVISNGVGENALYGYTDKAKIMEPAVTVAARGTIGYAEYRNYPFVPIIRLLTLIPKDKEVLNTKYLYYCLQGKEYKIPTTGISQLTAPMVKQVEIPVPKLKVQEKIVEVLDNFESICTDLNIGLPAEIEARQKQYEFYRDQILTFASTGKSILTDRQTDRV